MTDIPPHLRDNPAGRLWLLLSRALGSERNQSALMAWARALEIPEERILEVYGHVAALQRLPEEAWDTCTNAKNIPETMLRWTLPVKNLIEGSFRNPANVWSAYANEVSETVMDSLADCAGILSQEAAEPTYNEGDVASVLATAEKLMSQVAASLDLDEDAKSFLLAQITIIRDALIEIRISGIPVLVRSVEAVAGHLQNNPELIARANQTSEGRQATSFLSKLADLCTVAGYLSGPIAGGLFYLATGRPLPAPPSYPDHNIVNVQQTIIEIAPNALQIAQHQPQASDEDDDTCKADPEQ